MKLGTHCVLRHSKKKRRRRGERKKKKTKKVVVFKGRGLYNRVLLQSGIRARAALKAADSRCPALKLVVRPGGGRRQLSPPPFVFFCFSSLSLSLPPARAADSSIYRRV